MLLFIETMGCGRSKQQSPTKGEADDTDVYRKSGKNDKENAKEAKGLN